LVVLHLAKATVRLGEVDIDERTIYLPFSESFGSRAEVWVGMIVVECRKPPTITQ
jgi:hypothetical protein